MFIIISLLIVLSLPRVWLKPTLDESKFIIATEDDMTRDKRQAQIFDIIHQAIENYANCANEHLAPLKALANYKRYETLVYPEGYPPTSEAILGATNQQNKPNVKCTKVNLCSIEKLSNPVLSGYNANTPTVLGKSYYPTSDKSQENRGHIAKNYGRLSYHSGLKSPSNNNPPYIPNMSNKNNNYSLSAINRALLNILFNRPTTDPILGKGLDNTTPSGKSKTCTCSLNTTEKTPTTLESNDSFLNDEEGTTEEIMETSTESQSIVGGKLNNKTPSGKTKSCGCLKKSKTKLDQYLDTTKPHTTTITPPDVLLASDVKNLSNPLLGNKIDNRTTTGNIKPVDPLQGITTIQEIKTTTISTSSVESTHDSKNSSRGILNCTCPKFTTEKSPSLSSNNFPMNQNLNLLVLQLDLKSHNESKENLRQILKDLETLKTAMKISERSSDKMETTTIKTLSSTTTTTERVNSSTTLTTTTATNIVAPMVNTTTLIQTTNKTANNTRPPSLTDSKNSSVNISLNKNDDNITAIKSSSPLQLNITTDKDLTRITNQVHNLVSSMANETIHGNLKPNLNNSQDIKATNITIIRKTISSTNNQTLGVNDLNITDPNLDVEEIIPTKNHLNNVNALIQNLNDTMVSKEANRNVGGSLINSTVTISVSSNGNFKNIDIERNSDNSSNKDVEINEKEQMNLGSQKVRSIDMRGTGSRYINYLKAPQEKDPYNEPILSEIYPSKTKVKTKQPLSIYFHNIEQKSIKSQDISTGIWKTFQSHDFEDYDDDNNEDKENLSSFLKDCVDYENLSQSLESESDENYHKKELCKRNTFIT